MAEFRARRSSVMPLALMSCLTGGLTGGIVAVFRIALERAEIWRSEFLYRAHNWSALGCVLTIVIVSSLSGFAAWLVRKFAPYAAGSGIPHVEAVAKGQLPPAPPVLILVKFVGGLLAIGGGLALGREGPSVQMGAGIGMLGGKIFNLPEEDCIALLAACGGAGIAAAFNAPIAGAIFVLEELIRRFDTRIAIAALGSSSCAIAVARLFLGRMPDFHVGTLAYSGLGSGVLFVMLGILAGFFGIAYNGALIGALALADRLRWKIELRAAVIGAAVGLVAWIAPSLAGGGDLLTQRALWGAGAASVLPYIFLARFFLGPLSYAAGTPGGLFAPMLTIGAQLGALFAYGCGVLLPSIGVPPATFVITGMAAFFTAVVRAPVTGIVLAVELTGSFTQLMPLLWACFAAMIVPTILGVHPIYESLSQPTERTERSGPGATDADTLEKSELL